MSEKTESDCLEQQPNEQSVWDLYVAAILTGIKMRDGYAITSITCMRIADEADAMLIERRRRWTMTERNDDSCSDSAGVTVAKPITIIGGCGDRSLSNEGFPVSAPEPNETPEGCEALIQLARAEGYAAGLEAAAKSCMTVGYGANRETYVRVIRALGKREGRDEGYAAGLVDKVKGINE